MKKKVFIVLGIILLIVIIGSGNKPKEVSQTAEKTLGEQTSVEPTNSVEENFKIGDRVQRGDTILTVNKVTKDWKSTNMFDKPQSPDEVYVVINVTLENQGKTDLSLTGFWDFKIEDAQKVQRSESFTAGIGLKKLSGQSITSLSPGGKITGDLIFTIPKEGLSQMTLFYKPLVSFGQPAKIQLE